MAYSLRNGPRKNYKKLGDGVKLPRERPKRVDETLYPVEIVERNEERVKVHYIGYDSSYDEWKEAGELEVYDGGFQLESYVPFSLYTELRYQIKRALNSGSRKDPAVRIELAFDRVLFDGGLAKHGYMKKSERGHEVYGIKHFSSLAAVLGDKWHIRILNEHSDFCYVNLQTVEFYLHQRPPIMEFNTETSGSEVTSPGGQILVFKFVRMDGVKRQLNSVLVME